MSDFKRKIEIVESTTPPPNKYNWWFDLNEQKLKRFNSGEWVEYNTKPEIVVPMPKDNEIWLQLSPDLQPVYEDDVIQYIANLDYQTSELDSYKLEEDVLKIVLKPTIDSIYNAYLPRHIGDNSIIAVKLPKLGIIGTDMWDSAMSIPTVITQEVTEILENAISCDNLICLAQIPPEIGNLQGDLEMGEGVESVYVRDAVIDKYKSATNWSYMNIKELSSLDKSVYNWG